MLLLTIREWSGPGRGLPGAERASEPVEERWIAMATRLPLGEALERLRGYERGFNRRYPGGRRAVNFNLMSVSAIDDLEPQQLEAGRVELVEALEVPDWPEWGYSLDTTPRH